MIYDDRRHAGRVLALLVKARLERRHPSLAPIVLGLPRGGIPVAAEIAATLGAGLDAFVVRKLGVPGHEELAFGAVASGGVRVLNDDVVQTFLQRGGDVEDLEVTEQRERAELERRERSYRPGRGPLELAGKIAVLVDDGLATGATMRAAVRAARMRHPAQVMVAVPVGAATTCAALEHDGVELVCAQTLDDLVAVGVWYRDFQQTRDDEVLAILGAFRPNPAVDVAGP